MSKKQVPKPYRVVELPIDYERPPKINPRYRRFVVVGPPGSKPWWRKAHVPHDAQPNEVYRELGKDDTFAQMECRSLNDAYRLGYMAGKEHG